MARMLTCPNGCPGGRFEALNAPLVVDSAGRYVEHDARQAAYVCAECRSVAVDLVAAMREAEARDEADDAAMLVCPACGTEMLPPEDDPLAAVVECPACETRFTVEEGSPRLHGGGGADGGNGALGPDRDGGGAG